MLFGGFPHSPPRSSWCSHASPPTSFATPAPPRCSWKKERRGEARGESRGRAAEAASVTLRQLYRRCGTLNNPTTARTQGLPLEQLEALADALLDFTGPEDLAAWLAALAG